MGFHPEGVGAGHTREGNRESKRRHVTDGTVHQVLVYDGDRCVGWCQFGSPPEIPNIKNRGAYDRGADDPPDWRIGCVFTNAKDRGKGVAAAAVAAALEEIKRADGGIVEAYPEQTEQRPPQRGAYLHTGPEELYAQYGFTRSFWLVLAVAHCANSVAPLGVQIVKNVLRLLSGDGWPTPGSRRPGHLRSGAVMGAGSRSGPGLDLTGRGRDWRWSGAGHALRLRPPGGSQARDRARGCQNDDGQQNGWRHLVLHGAPPQ